MTFKEKFELMNKCADISDWTGIINIGNIPSDITCNKDSEFDYFMSCVSFVSLAHELITQQTLRESYNNSQDTKRIERFKTKYRK